LKMCSILLGLDQLSSHVCNEQGMFSVHFAAKGGQYSCFSWLAERDFKENKLPKSKLGLTPLHLAALYGRYWFLKQALKDFGVGAFLVETNCGETVLHYACRSLNFDVIDFVINECGLSMSHKDKAGNTPIHHAVLYAHFVNKTNINKKAIIEFNEKFGVEYFFIENNEHQTPYNFLSSEHQDIVREYGAPSVDLSI
ncbi:MAG: ankyrin repeat domain-containing protein, partial [Pseudomonadota bacterium]|nr:ankyrin repeat domain-containing protein [Pseudomonadota bacterium]